MTHTSTVRSISRPTPGLNGRTLEKIAPHLYRVTDDSTVQGYIEEVGVVYVTLVGSRYDRSVEIAQSLSLELAALAIRDLTAA